MPPERIAMRVRVTGGVQGVGYRHFSTVAAASAGIAGWVRNRRDGSVECHAEGDPAAIEAFLADLRRGPRFSEVEGIRTERVPLEGLAGFSIKPTE